MSSTFTPRGVYPALPTPIAADGSINRSATEAHLAYLEAGGVDGVVPAGCTGHAATLGDRGDGITEHVDYVAHVAGSTDLPVIAGDGTNSTQQTIELAQAIEAAADIAAHLIITPYQNGPPQDRLIEHYRQVASALDRPVIAYNVPGRTGVNLEAETALELATLENVVGIKEASLDFQQIHEIGFGLKSNGLTNEFALGSGDDAANHYIYQQGGTFTISVAANVHPAGTVAVWEAAVRDNDMLRAFETNQELQALHDVLFLPGEKNPIPVQYAMNLLGFDFGTPRAPLDRKPRQDDRYQNREKIEQALERYDLK